MKIAEALLLRSELLHNLNSLKERIARNARLQEGDVPDEDPMELIKKCSVVLDKLQKIITRIHRTNVHNTVPDGTTILELLMKRDRLVRQRAVVVHTIQSTVITERERFRYSATELKWEKQVDVTALEDQSHELARQIRQVNSVIQETNWKVELED